MDMTEMLVDRLREIAMGVDFPVRRALNQAADWLENQRIEILALSQIAEKQTNMNQSAAELALELDNVTAERDALLDEIRGMCNLCKHFFDGVGDSVCSKCDWDKNWEWRGLEGKDG